MSHPVPLRIEDITAEWLDDALREAGRIDVDVVAVEVEPFPGVGLLGDLARLRPRYARGAGPASLVVKLPASDPGARRVGMMLNAWAREVAFYRLVAPKTPGVRLPRCYATSEDRDAGRWAIVLEDCRADPFDPNHGATAAQAGAAVDALADFHAAWWDTDERFDWMPGFDRTGVGGLQPLWLDSLPLFLDRYAHVVPEPTGRWVTRFAPQLTQWSARVGTEPLTMVHADYRIDNLLFDGDDVIMIDWQTALRGPPAMDLSCFVATSLSIENRRTHEAALIDRYLDGLTTAGVDVDRAWFAQSYDENLLWWMGQFGNNLARLNPKDDVVQRALDLMIERVYQAALDRNVGRLLA